MTAKTAAFLFLMALGLSLTHAADNISLNYNFDNTSDPNRNPFSFWTSNGTHTDSLTFSMTRKVTGSFSLKCDITLGTASYVYYQVPLSIPLEGTLTVSGNVSLDNGSSTAGVQAALGTGYVYSPTSVSGNSPITVYSTSSSAWNSCQRDVITNVQQTGPNVVGNYVWGGDWSNISPKLMNIYLGFYGQPGNRIIVYFDNISITGQVTSAADYNTETTSRWAPVLSKTNSKISHWNSEVSQIDALLPTLTNLTAEQSQLVTASAAKESTLKSQIASIQAAGTIQRSQYRSIDLFLKTILANLNAVAADQVTTTGCLIYSVPPITTLKLLPTDPLICGYAGTGLSLTAAIGEFEAASLGITAIGDNLTNLLLTSSNLTGPGGATIPAANVNIRSVKCWYQAGTAWSGISQSKNTKIMVPELLLKNDALVRVDTTIQDNYLECTSGEKWISDPTTTPAGLRMDVSVDNYSVQDGTTLQPLTLSANTNKQYWITLKVPAGTAAGTYTGSLTFSTATGTLAAVPFTVTVLGFTLPSPKTYYDNNTDFVSSIYYRGLLADNHINGSISSEYKSVAQMTAELQDMYDHGITNPLCYQDYTKLGTVLDMRKAIGWPAGQGLYVCSNIGTESSWSVRNSAITTASADGISPVYFYGRDEATGTNLSNQYPIWQQVYSQGGKVYTAGGFENWDATYYGSYLHDYQDVQIQSGWPVASEAAKWHSIGHSIWSYANPQGGPEDPELFRRNFGLVLWKANYNGAATYAYQDGFGNVWNDFDDPTYRDHNLTYPTVNGVVDTLAIEGYREGIDDIRYGNKLQSLIAEGLASSNPQTVANANAAQTYLNNMDVTAEYPEELRADLINYIQLLIAPPSVTTPSISIPSGTYTAPQSVTITCATDNATIRYTTDGTTPNDNSTLYTGAIVVNQSMTLKAIATKDGMSPSAIASATYTFYRPVMIPYGRATVDGNLNDWAGIQWAPLDQNYYQTAPDVLEAYYAAKWISDKVYVAVKVRDTYHRLKDSYGAWNTGDMIEVYLHTTGGGATDYSTTQASAQQYCVGIRTDNTTTWSVLGNNLTIPAQANFLVAGKVDGDWLYYEVAMTPYQTFSLSGSGLVLSPLAASQSIGLDVVAGSVINVAGTYGCKSENLFLSKYNNYTKIVTHQLAAAVSGDTNFDGVVDAADLSIVLTAMDAKPGDPAWNIQADLDNDGEVTSADLAIVLANMQQ